MNKYRIAILQISRILVGVLFIFSGLIKLNDPIGTAIKLDEYFTVFEESFAFFAFFKPFATFLSVIFCASEVVLGIALLLWYRIRLISLLLLLLILFFTFLTFYSAYFNKVTDCGCFGDAIKLTPWTSFTKDLILLVFIIYIFIHNRVELRSFNVKILNRIIAISTILSLATAYYAIEHLSFIDFRPYKIGASIPESMKLPPGALPDVYETRFTLNHKISKEQKVVTDKEYIQSKIWEDTLWVIDNTKTKSEKIQEGVKPKITDYRIFNEEEDLTQKSFEGKKLLVLVDFVEKSNLNGVKKINELAKSLKDTDIETWYITSSAYNTYEPFRHEMQLGFPFYNADPKVIKTIIRCNPGVVLLKNGVVMGKWHHNDTPTKSELVNLGK